MIKREEISTINDIMEKNTIFQRIKIRLDNSINMMMMKMNFINSNNNFQKNQKKTLLRVLALVLRVLALWALHLKELNNYFERLLEMKN